MKKLIYFFLLLPICSSSFSQTYDLIINSNGDSIACQIDSLNDEEIYFTMKSNGNWHATKTDRSQVVEYRYDAIKKSRVVFRPQTSFITQIRDVEKLTISDLPKNSVWAGIMTLNYGRMFPMGKAGFSLSGGLSFIDGFSGVFIQVESTLLIGGPKHFFEPGLFYFTDYNDHLIFVRTGYRYQAKKGFLFRAAPLFTLWDSELTVFPSLCVGYSF